jgi:hypothetical protein
MKYLRWILIGLIAILIILLIVLFVQYQSLQRAQLISDHEFLRSQMLERHAPLPASEANVIRSWMTFDYINKIFGLSPDYLKTQLSISDSRYPRLTVAAYGGSAGIDQATLLNDIENAIRNYTTAT